MATKGNDKECIVLPALVNSDGIWESLLSPNGKQIWEYSLPLLEIFIVLIFFFWQLFYLLFKHFGFLKFTMQLFAGIILSRPIVQGNSLLINVLYPDGAYQKTVIGTMGAFGYTMFWFLMGVKMDVGMIFRTGKNAMAVGIATVVTPMVVCLFLYRKNIGIIPAYSSEYKPEYSLIIAYQCLSTFPVVANLLSELKIQNSELGRLGLSSALVSDMLGAIISVLVTLVRLTNSVKKSVKDGVAVCVFLFFIVFIFRPAMYWVIRQTPEGRPVKAIYIHGILVLVFASAVYADKYDQFLPFGPFVLGLAVPDGPPLGSALIEKFESFVSSVFLPFFVATCAMKVDISVDYNSLSISSLIFLIFIIKLVASLLPSLICKMPLRDAFVLAIVMSKKGIVELASYYFALDRKNLSNSTFTLLTIMILLNSIVLPSLVKILYDPSRKYAGYKKRDMLHLKPNSELRILACIHRPDNITPMINLLEASCPTKVSPIDVYVLHLIELIGQAHPIFISHQMQKRKVGNHSYSDNVILSFTRFQRDYWGLVYTNSFTSVSSPKHMHEDICMLSLDKLTSLILLPFHRTWSIDGSTLVSDNNMIRNLNCSVLEKAPCSVGILVDRSRLGCRTIKESSETSYQVCMIFFGGKDDREALTLAKRMAKDSRLSLSVVRFISTDDDGVTDWERMLDTTELKDVKENNVGDEYVIYIEEVVKDGTETSLVLQSMVDEYDLFIVGRGAGRETPLTKGLEEWSEFHELGIIGDLLASPDLDSRGSVLVVQQQQMI